MGIWTALLFSAVTALPPLKPVATIDLSSQGTFATDVAWLGDDQVLIALLHGGVARVSLDSKQVTQWVPQGEPPNGSPATELVATDGKVVVVMGAGSRSFTFRNQHSKYVSGYSGGQLYPRGVAVVGGQAVYMGWMGRAGDDDTLRRGVLWTQSPGESNLAETPIHRVFGGNDAVTRWRSSTPPYAGSVVALGDGSIAVMTVAEPGIYRYDRTGKLIETLAGGDDALVLDSMKLVKEYANDVRARYTDFINRRALVEDLVSLPGNRVGVLVRTADKDEIQWALWQAERSGFGRAIPLATKVPGPFAHMRCESRGQRLACVTNVPDAAQATKPETAGANPRLLLYQLPK